MILKSILENTTHCTIETFFEKLICMIFQFFPLESIFCSFVSGLNLSLQILGEQFMAVLVLKVYASSIF